MKYALALVAMFAFASLVGTAQEKNGKPLTVKGYVVDAMCAKGILKKTDVMKEAAAHTQDCALEENCSSGGYGLFSESKWMKFDDGGDKLAKSLIEKSKKEKGIGVEVTGKMEGEKLVVASIKEVSLEAKAGKKTAPAEKK